MATKLTFIGAAPSVTTGADVINAGPQTPAVADQNLANLRGAVDSKAANLLTGYVSGAGTVAPTDSVLQAIQKLNGNAAGSTAMNFAASSITFPATQVASSDPNTLDDYEEGTFTPATIGSTTAGVGTYISQIGSYTKTGRVVTFTLSLNWSAHTGTGGIRLGGLPFVSSVIYTPIVSIFVNNLTYTGTHLHAYVVSGQTYAALSQVASGTSSTEVPMDTAGQVSLSGSYYV